MTVQTLPRLFGWGLALASASLLTGPTLPAMAEPEPTWYNCLTREVFTPDKQAWCDRWQALQTSTVIVPLGNPEAPTYRTITLENGEYQDPNGSLRVALVNEPGWLTFGDINGDGRMDGAAIIGVVPGPTTTPTTYIVAVLDIDGAAQALNPVALGERLLLNGPITIDNQRIHLPQLTQTEVVNRAFVADGGTLSELAQLPTPERVPGGVPDGTLLFSNTAAYGVRVFTQGGQPHLNLFNRRTGRQELTGVKAIALSSVDGVTYSYGGNPSQGQPQVNVTVAPDGAQTLEVNGQLQTNLATVTGTVTYRPRIALPPNAVVEIALVDVSRADAPSLTLASQTVITAGRQVPIPFELVYNPEQIGERYTYAVQARITVDGQLQFINTTHHPVLTEGHPNQVEITVEPVNR